MDPAPPKALPGLATDLLRAVVDGTPWTQTARLLALEALRRMPADSVGWCRAVAALEEGPMRAQRAVDLAELVLEQLQPDDDAPLPIEGVAPETVRITLLWTGDPGELDLALLTLREDARALGELNGLLGERGLPRRVVEARRLAAQILTGALGEDDDEDEPHEHLGVVRWERTVPDTVTLVFFIHGEHLRVTAAPDEDLREVCARALADAGEDGRSLPEWELRDDRGDRIDLLTRVRDLAAGPLHLTRPVGHGA